MTPGVPSLATRRGVIGKWAPNHQAAVFVLLAINAVLFVWLATWNAWVAPDWEAFALVPVAHPYTQIIVPPDIPTFWRYSPVALWLIQPVAIMAGRLGFALLHLALLALLPRRTALIVGISFPFWVDLIFGNVFTLVFVAAYWAVRGNRAGAIAFAVLTLLMPRPVQFPLLVWLLGRDSLVRQTFFVLFAAHLLLVVGSGFTVEWATRLLTDPTDMGAWFNASPSRFLGYGWLLVGVPLAGWLFVRGRPAWAGLAIAPYLLPQYWLLAFAEPLHLPGPNETARALPSRVVPPPPNEAVLEAAKTRID